MNAGRKGNILRLIPISVCLVVLVALRQNAAYVNSVP